MTLIDNKHQMRLRAFLDSIRDGVLRASPRRIQITFYIVMRIHTLDGYKKFAVMSTDPYALDANEVAWKAMTNKVCSDYEYPRWVGGDRWTFVSLDSVMVEPR